MDKVLKKWEQEEWASAETRHWQKLAYIILVKLCAYQFALPVCWTQTQDLLVTTFNFEHLIELGPSPTDWDGNLYMYEILDGSVSRYHSILCHAKNVKEIYYQYENEIEGPASNETVDIPIAAAPVTTTAAVSTPSSGQSRGHSVSIKAFNILLVIVA